MADQSIGITFLPTADAAANGPRQAGIEGPGGSDLAAAFKILSLHLPRVLGASAIAPKRVLTGQGSAGLPSAGMNPYAAVFQSLLQSYGMGGGSASTGSPDLSSLLGSATRDGSYGMGGNLPDIYGGGVGIPDPKMTFDTGRSPDISGGTATSASAPSYGGYETIPQDSPYQI
jgi:hypothetical protein